MAKASTQSTEHLAAVKQALRALGFNKQVQTYVTDYLGSILLSPSNIRDVTEEKSKGGATVLTHTVHIKYIPIKN